MLHHTRAAETTEDGGAGRDVPSNTSDYPPKIKLMETLANRIKIISGVGTITGMKLDQIPKLTHFKFFNLRNANWFLFFHYPERIKQFLIPPPPSMNIKLSYNGFDIYFYRFWGKKDTFYKDFNHHLWKDFPHYNTEWVTLVNLRL